MFRFSTDQQHALQHGLQDLGKLTLAVLFLGGAIGMQTLGSSHTQTPLKNSAYQALQHDRAINVQQSKALQSI